MEIIKEENRETMCVKFVAKEEGAVVARAYLYILHNDLHAEPFAFMEDLFVEEASRGKGVGTAMMQAIQAEARAQQCYKLIFTARHVKPEVHEWYTHLGFTDWGKEFRMNF